MINLVTPRSPAIEIALGYEILDWAGTALVLSGFFILPERDRRELVYWGPVICAVGTYFALLFPPCKVLGTSAGWRFIFGQGSVMQGRPNAEFIDVTALLLELILINGIGLALLFIGRKRQ